MATGSPLPINNIGAHGVQGSSTIKNTCSLNSAAPCGRFRIGAGWANSTSITWGNAPSGWTKHFEAAIGTLKCGIYYHPNWNVNDNTTASDFTVSASVICGFNGSSWEGVDAANPIALAAATAQSASGSTGTTLTCPAFTAPADTAFVLWFAAARVSTGGTTASFDPPSDLVGSGSTSLSGSAGIVQRTAVWAVNTAAPNRAILRTPISVGSKLWTVTGTAVTVAATAVIAMALRPATRADGHAILAA